MSAASVAMVQVDCCICGIVFWVPQQFDKQRLEDKRSWYCPNGHSQSYTGKTEAQKLREQLEQERAQRQRVQMQLLDAEYRAENPELSELQHADAEWLRDHVKGVGWTRAEAIIREFGRARTFAEAGDAEVAEVLSARLGHTVSLNFAREMVHRTQVALRVHGKKLIPAEAGPSNL